jgi:hypothetical protein
MGTGGRGENWCDPAGSEYSNVQIWGQFAEVLATFKFVEDHGALECDVFTRGLLAAVEQYGDNRPFDDVTLVVAKWR